MEIEDQTTSPQPDGGNTTEEGPIQEDLHQDKVTNDNTSASEQEVGYLFFNVILLYNFIIKLHEDL